MWNKSPAPVVSTTFTPSNAGHFIILPLSYIIEPWAPIVQPVTFAPYSASFGRAFSRSSSFVQARANASEVMRISAYGRSSAMPSLTVPASKFTSTPSSFARFTAARAPFGLCPSICKILAPSKSDKSTSSDSSSGVLPRVQATLRAPVGSSIQQYASGDSQPLRTFMPFVQTFSASKSSIIFLPSASSPIALTKAAFNPSFEAATVELPAGPPP